MKPELHDLRLPLAAQVAGVLGEVTNRDDIGTTDVEDAQYRPTPAEAYAKVAISYLQETRHPEMNLAASDGILVVVRVPDADLANALYNTWEALVRSPWTADSSPLAWVQVARAPQHDRAWEGFGGRNAPRPLDLDDFQRVLDALARGRSVYLFLSDRISSIPERVLAHADLVLDIPPLDATLLAQVIEQVTGEKPSQRIDPGLASRITLSDLSWAYRPGRTADAYLALIRQGKLAVETIPQVTLDDLCGYGAAADWGKALSRDIQAYRRGELAWREVDRGILLSGPPGVGKTLFARALAGSCGAHFSASSLAEWQAAGHLGDLLKSMRKTFSNALQSAPSILLLDEIDAIGDRGTFDNHNAQYCTEVVNALLEQIDGAYRREGIVVVAACNNPGRIDPALLRAGRLEMHIPMGLPAHSDLIEILKYHLRPTLQHADLHRLATLMQGSTGADCELLVRRARRIARNRGNEVSLDDLFAALPPSSRASEVRNIEHIAIHEAGHAMAAIVQRGLGALTGVSIRQTHDVTGMTGVVDYGRGAYTRADFQAMLREILAGRAAEAVFFGQPSAGAGGSAASDLARATSIATAVVTAFGLGDAADDLAWQGLYETNLVPGLLFANPAVRAQVNHLLSEAYSDALAMIRKHAPGVKAIANLLLEKDALTGQEIGDLLRNLTSPKQGSGKRKRKDFE